MKKYFSISAPLMRENFKMTWFLPVIMFLAMFFIMPFQMFTLGRVKMEDLSYYINNFLDGWNVGMVGLAIVIPLIAACIVMNYYHKPDMAFALNSQPLSRQRLFNTQVLSGWLMFFIPIIVIALMMILMQGLAVVNITSDGSIAYSFEESEVVGTKALYVTRDVLSWLVTYLSLTTFFYGIYILAGAITGTAVVQVLGSGVLWGALPAVILLVQAYLQEFYVGYASFPAWIDDLLSYSNPIIRLLMYGKEESTGYMFIYFFAGLLLIALSQFAVSKAKMEHVGDGMIFGLIEEASTWLVAIIFGLAIGLLFTCIAPTVVMAFTGVIVGGVVFFAVTKIIIGRSVKIFNKKNIKSCAFFLIFAVLLTSALTFDFFGFSKRVPKAEDVESVVVNNMFAAMNDFDDYYDTGLNSKDYEIDDEETIKAVIALHQYIIDNDLYFDRLDEENRYIEYYYGLNDNTRADIEAGRYSDYVCFNYNLKNGNRLERTFRFTVNSDTIELANDIVNQEAYKEKHRIKDQLIGKKQLTLSFTTNYNLYAEKPTYDYEEPLNSEYISINIRSQDNEIILDAIDKDLMKWDYYGGESNSMRYSNVINDKLEFLKDVGQTKEGWCTYEYSEIYASYDNPDSIIGDRCTRYISLPNNSIELFKVLDGLGYLDRDAITESGGSIALD